MSEMRTIEIDFEIHKRIELERSSFTETPNTVLRRLLKIDGVGPAIKAKPVSLERPWVGKGVTLPHGTDLRMEINGRVHEGRIYDGRWLIEDKKYSTPSGAACSVARTKGGNHTSLNGWNYWEIKRPGDTNWITLRSLRNSEK